MSQKSSEPSSSHKQQNMQKSWPGEDDDGVKQHFDLGSTNKIYKNLIICGEVDYHCLICEVSMNNDADVEKHIQCENHRKLVEDTLYMPEFTNECIKKVGDNFYCEICNLLLTASINIASHVKEEIHIAKKQAPDNDLPLKSVKIVRDDKNIKILDTFIMSEAEWNGIKDNHCHICDVNLEDGVEHLRKPNHVRNLIQSPIVFLEGQKFYRTIKGDLFYCFICEGPYSKSHIVSHWTSKQHENKKKTSRVLVNNGAGTSKPSFNVEFKKNMKKMFHFSDESKSDKTSQKQIPKEDDSFQMRDDISDYVDVKDLLADSIAQMSCEKKRETVGTPYMDRQAILKTFGEDISLLSCGELAYCNLCKTSMKAHLKNINEHIQYVVHVSNILKMKNMKQSSSNSPPESTKIPLKSYISSIKYDEEIHDFWINNKINIEEHSFSFLNFLDDDGIFNIMICYLCNEIFPSDQDDEHCRNERHRKTFFETKVMTSLDDEFIREIQPNFFHCGFCNEVFATWIEVKCHLTSYYHIDTKEQQHIVSDYTRRKFWWITEDTNTAERDIYEMRLAGVKLI